ncbi:hypothetical protein NE237_000119 [Protea cynaroides]|uniref:Uncharacterized protein n=1 Tax=Protea cynaroides TaxID=273540 RepID=A0A9Q0GL02_9MAGN|nr:hypothetical protein NE237_000119 [Protea cynaroides]
MPRCSGILVHQELRDLLDASLMVISRGCSRLTKFEIQGCKNITETGMERFVGMLCWKNDTSIENGIIRDFDVLSMLQSYHVRMSRVVPQSDSFAFPKHTWVGEVVAHLVVVAKRNDYQYASIVGSFSKEWTEACLRARYSLSSICPWTFEIPVNLKFKWLPLWSAGMVSGRCGGLAGRTPFHTCLWELYAIAFWWFLVGCHNLYRPWVQYPGFDK